MVDTMLRQVVQVVVRVETEVIIMVPVLQVKDLEVVPPEVLPHMPVAEVAALAVQVELDKAAMLEKAAKVDK
jgi:hypothetical protein